MTLRRWESVVEGIQGNDPYEVVLGRHFFRSMALLRTTSEPSRATVLAIHAWNQKWPDKLHSHRWFVRRRQT